MCGQPTIGHEFNQESTVWQTWKYCSKYNRSLPDFRNNMIIWYDITQPNICLRCCTSVGRWCCWLLKVECWQVLGFQFDYECVKRRPVAMTVRWVGETFQPTSPNSIVNVGSSYFIWLFLKFIFTIIYFYSKK